MPVVVLIPAIWLLCRNAVDLQSRGILPGSSPSPASFPLPGACAIGKWRTVRVWFMVMSRKKKKTSACLNLPKVENITKQARGGTHCIVPIEHHLSCVVLAATAKLPLLALDYCLLSSYLLEWGWRRDVQPSLLCLLLLMILHWLNCKQIQNPAF